MYIVFPNCFINFTPDENLIMPFSQMDHVEGDTKFLTLGFLLITYILLSPMGLFLFLCFSYTKNDEGRPNYSYTSKKITFKY